MDEPIRVNIVPCSGIGKPFGSVSRAAAYQVTGDDRPDNTQIVPLALLVMGDEEYRARIAANPSITLDGCKLACATKMVQECGGRIAHEIAVLDVYRRNRELKPEGISELNDDGLKLADAMAKEVDALVDEIVQPGGRND